MFCVKCGIQIKEDDKFCPSCGAKNENCTETSVNSLQSSITEIKKKIQDGGNSKENIANWSNKIKFIIPVALIAIVIIIGIMVVPTLLKSIFNSGKIEYSNRGMTAYIDEFNVAYFIDESGTVTFDSSIESGSTTPDHSKYILLGTDQTLSYCNREKADSVEISDKVEVIGRVSDKGCFYMKNDYALYYYNFKNKKESKLGFEYYDITYSAGATTIAGVDESGQLYLFSDGDESPEKLLNIGENARVCAVADNGGNVLWYIDDSESINVYMIINDVPEKIGTLINKGLYNFAYGIFFDDNKSFLVDSPNSTTMLVSIDGGSIEEVALPGLKGYETFMDSEGNEIDSDDDSLSEYYLSVFNDEDKEIQSIYKWIPGRKMKEITSNIRTSINILTTGKADYSLVGGHIYYIDDNDDLYKKKLDGDKNKEKKITTDVDAVYIPKVGEYAYIVKLGSLYYMDLSDKSNKLNIVCGDFSSENRLFTTDLGNVIYYRTEEEYIGETYSTKGVLYRYKIGEEPVKIADDVMNLILGDSPSYSASAPVIRQYVSHEDKSLVVNYGTIENDKFVIKAANADY